VPETFSAVFPGVDVLPLTDGLAAVFNAEDTDARRTFEVTRIVARTPAAWGGQNAFIVGGIIGAATLALYRTTAATGGETVEAHKRDTGSADLPAQVTCALFPTQVTLSGAPLRTVADAPTTQLSTSGLLSATFFSQRNYGGALTTYMKQNTADLFRFGGDSTIQRLVLREGEGLALCMASFGQPRSGQFNLTVRNASSGATYQFRSRDIGHARGLGDCLFSIFNASGSGVVLEVNSIEYPNDGEHNFPTYRLARIDAASIAPNITAAAMDTANAVPAALQCYAGDFATKLAGSDTAGLQYDWQSTHGATFPVAQQQNAGVMRRTSGIKPTWAPTLNQGFQSGNEEHIIFEAKAGAGIVLNPREGLALLAGRAGIIENSTFLYLDFEFTVLHYPPPAAPGGGGNTYARSRVVNV